MDGSLVIMFHYKNKRIFCTRGSFTSEQARRAENIFERKYKDIEVKMECTYCFEVIYPQNKIVVDYENIEDLFLISITLTSTGREINTEGSGFKTVHRILEYKSIEDMMNIDVSNKEGFVVKFNTGIRIKIKFKTYIAYHKGKTFSFDSIKQTMKKMKKVDIDNIPDECFTEVNLIITEIEEEFSCVKQKLEKEYKYILEDSKTPRDIVEAIKKSQYASILFYNACRKRI